MVPCVFRIKSKLLRQKLVCHGIFLPSFSCIPVVISSSTTKLLTFLNSTIPHGLSSWPKLTCVCRLSSWESPSHLPRTMTEVTSSMQPWVIPLPTRYRGSTCTLIRFIYVLVTLQGGCLSACSPQIIFEIFGERAHASIRLCISSTHMVTSAEEAFSKHGKGQINKCIIVVRTLNCSRPSSCLKTDISAGQNCIWKQSMLTPNDSLEGSLRVSFMSELQGVLLNCSKAPFVHLLSLGHISIRVEFWLCTLSLAVQFGFCWLLSITIYLESAKVKTKSHLTSEWERERVVGSICLPESLLVTFTDPSGPPSSLLSPCSGPKIIILWSYKGG